MYDATLGRFLERDPIGFIGYLYGRDAPVVYVDPSGLREHSASCGKFTVTNTASTDAVIGGAKGYYSVRITYEPTQNCCCCTQIKLFQMVRRYTEQPGGWLPDRTPGQHNKSEHYDAWGWKVDTATEGVWWYTGGTPKFGSCKPTKRNAEITDRAGWNRQASWSFITCAICTAGPDKDESYGCVWWEFSINATGKVAGGSEFIWGDQAASINNDTTVKAWNDTETSKIPTAKECCKDR